MSGYIIHISQYKGSYRYKNVMHYVTWMNTVLLEPSQTHCAAGGRGPNEPQLSKSSNTLKCV